MSLIKGIESTCELSQLEGIESSLGLVNLIVDHLNL